MPNSVEDLINRQQDLYTRIANSVENLKKLGSASITVGAVESRLQLLDSNWHKFETFHEQILAAAKDEHRKLPYFQNDVFGTAEEFYATRKGVMFDMLSDLRATHTSMTAAAPSYIDAPRQRASLPRIHLPQFTGRYADWPAFRDLFSSLIIREQSLSNVERLHYLKTSVTGDAASLLRNISTTDANFEHAWQVLRNRYENRRLLVAAQIGSLSSLRAMAAESASELKRLLDSTRDAVSALDALECPITNGTYWLAHLTAERLDRRSRRDWETSLGSQTEPPTFDTLQRFLEDRLRALEAIEQARSSNDSRTSDSSAKSRGAKLHHAVKGEGASDTQRPAGRCPLCSKNHYVLFCPSYQARSPAQRKSAVDTAKLCTNCLGRHLLRECQSSKRCQRCEGRHHTSLHDAVAAGGLPSTSSSAAATPSTSHLAHTLPIKPSAVLLATARVRVFADNGSCEVIRALVDPGSEVSLISEALVQRLRLSRMPASLPVIGVGSRVAHTTRGRVTCSVSSVCGELSRVRVAAFVLPRLSAYRPRCSRAISSWQHLSGLTLADPRYADTDAIDLLLGADIYASLLLPGLRKGASDAPIAQETIFGWILSGSTSAGVLNPEITAHQCSVDSLLLDCVQRFWEQEEVGASTPVLTPDERACEAHYRSTVSRLSDGRYVVRLPLRRPRDDLGESRRAALRTLASIERRFLRDPHFEQLYRQFVSEYQTLGHMLPCAMDHHGQGQICYLPHHGVLKDGGKLRVVFNGSQRTTSGLSLNDIQHVGPKLQRDLREVLLRWRVHRFVFTADIEKMYRQIRLHEDDWDLQRVLWREQPDSRAEDYHLTTVTYGQAAAPFLAIRTLRQLAEDEGKRFPCAARILTEDVYVDDILTGATSAEEAARIASELVDICRAGGFPLGKWASNAAEVVSSLPGGAAASFLLEWPDPTGRSVLGLEWRPTSDCFSYRIQPPPALTTPTKRAVLSLIARLFDPLGWIAPVTVRAKIFMQSLWLLKVGWDDPLPPRECSLWNAFQVDLANIGAFSIPRWLGLNPRSRVQLFGFADASERALAAVVYLRAESEADGITVQLVAAKTKVAPVRQLALPRLELCAATLLVRLVKMIRGTLNFQDVPAHLYSDSTVVLSWIRSHPSRWKTFVANRVAEIQTTETAASWRHVASGSNPADCASRGLDAARLAHHSLWWSGPPWLSAEHLNLAAPSTELPEDVSMEARVTTHTLAQESEREDPLLLRFSSWHRLLRVTAWCLRWRQILRSSSKLRSSDNDSWSPGFLRPVDLLDARSRWVINVQRRSFEAEVNALVRGRNIPARSSLLRLSPFLDEQGQLRVGGRLKHALLEFDERHPIILPSDSHLTYLLADAVHRRTLHGGVQLTLTTLRRTFWILQGRRVVKSVIHRCLQCIRWRATTPQQLMAPLPSPRVRPSRPFLHAGVDYAGPFFLRTAPGRGHKAYKGYVAIFVCLATRAVHIETVSSYSTEAFLAAYRRFAARRGVSAVLYSDCGTTFTGADAELRSLFRAASSTSREIAAALSNDGTEWRFNPPAAPHFGGLWEAAVRSTKHHLRRVIGERTLTYEEMSTLLNQIEACLNSRPLQAISDDPDDLSALTPAHFLVGSALNTVPEPSLEDVNLTHLTRWQMVQQMLQSFWRRWSDEYLTNLQGRSKWSRSGPDFQVGDMCLLRNDLLPPSKWPLARVTSVHPGEDGHVRVITLRTSSSASLTRPISKVVRLPIRDSA